MQITEITVTSGRTFNHPYESFSNLRPTISLKATLTEGDNVDKEAKNLQCKAESLVEAHKEKMLGYIERKYEHNRKIEEAELELRILKGQKDDLPF